jgi:hypothetical protein
MRDARASETHDQRHGRLARLRQRYAASPELRELLAEHRRRTKRNPDIREKMKEYHKLARQKECLLGNNSREQLRHLDLMTRRAILLNAVIRRLQRSNQQWAWKSHTPVLDKDRVDRMKFLGNATDANSDQNRYMCNNSSPHQTTLHHSNLSASTLRHRQMRPRRSMRKIPRVCTKRITSKGALDESSSTS